MELLGVPAKSFRQMYENKATEIMRTVHEYIKTVKASARAGAGAGAESGNKTTITLDPTGFPIAPRPPSWDKTTKEEFEKLYRSYITHHYRAF